MTESFDEKTLKSIINNMIDAENKELQSIPEESLEENWFFKYDKKRSKEMNLYEFMSMLNLYARKCRNWEEMHNGNCCVVERTRDKYTLPKIRQFLKDLEEHDSHE